MPRGECIATMMTRRHRLIGIGLCCAALMGTPAFAEDFAVGAEAGVTASRFSPSSAGESITLGPGVIAGFYAIVPIRKSLSLMPELVYVQKYSSRAGGGDVRIEYVEIPLLVKMPVFRRAYISEGVGFGFPVNAWGFGQGLSLTTSPDAAIVIGGGYDFRRLAIEFRYEGGLRHLSRVASAPIQRSRSFTLMVKIHT